MKNYLLLLFLFLISTTYAQNTTSIPDETFEQALIDLGIDSDNNINGQVLTSDIDTVKELDLDQVFNFNNMTDLTGIQDFAALKYLNISHSGTKGNYPDDRKLDLTSLQNLEKIRMNSDGDNITVAINSLILNNNPNLRKIISLNNWYLDFIDLKGSDLEIDSLSMDLNNYIDSPNICIQVSDAAAAENATENYEGWIVSGAYSFSENCSLATEKFTKNDIRLYPNPAKENFHVKSERPIQTLKIYNLQGKTVKVFSTARKTYSIADLAEGLYIVKMKSGNKTLTEKLIIE